MDEQSLRNEAAQIVRPKVHFALETDGRWIAEIPYLPGVLAYGITKEDAAQKAAALARAVIGERQLK